jgi:peptidyl-prolyl cis-trans isomerase A (cyclophilin A)
MKPTWSAALAVLALASIDACAKNEPEPSSSQNTTPAAANAPAPQPAAKATVPGSVASPVPGSSVPLASVVHPLLLDPGNAKDTAPTVFKARFTTTKGPFVIEVHRDWAPVGADRFYNLVKLGFYDDTRFFRVVDNFMVQFGISGDPAVNAKWQESGIADEPGKQSNKRGFVTYAQRGTPNSRTTQIFVNTVDNSRLDVMHFVPFGQVVEGMDVVDSLYKGYGEGAPMGAGPDQSKIQSQGNSYLDAKFPKLDAVKKAEIVK